jgi:PAS domain S-box-containing protein
MSHQITKALRIAFLAMVGALIFETTKQVSAYAPIWGSHTHTILFITVTTLVISIIVLHREAKAEDAFIAGERRFKSVLQSGLDGFYVVDTSGKLLDVNDAYCLISGYTREELLQMRVSELECTETEQDVAAHIQRIIRQGEDRFESRHRRKNGKVINIETSVNFQNCGGGQFFCFLRDITERKRAEQALRESEERFRQVVESSPVGIFIQTDGIHRYFNPAALAILGAESANQLVGRSYLEIMHPDSRASVAERARIVREEKQAVPFMEERVVRVDGTVVDGEITAVPFIYEGRDGALVFIRDITERKREEKARRESEERFRQVVEGAPIGMYIHTDVFLQYLNPAALIMFGAESIEQLVGQRFLDRVHPNSRAAVMDRAHTVREQQKAAPLLEEQYLRMDGTAFDIEANAIPFIYEGQSGAAVFFRDITERKRQEERRRGLELQLRQAQKMEAVGRLAGGIAHDFNNLLMVIQSYTEMLQDSLPVHDGSRKNTEQVLKAADRAASLTRQMLAFSRKQITSPRLLDLNVVVNETTKMLGRLIGEDIDVRIDLAKSLWAINADTDQIGQILMNLCINSRDAMPQGGTLTIATDNITVEQGSYEGHPDVETGEYVRLSVTDTGTGICKEEQEKIFEPFFTTKKVGKGTGLGLAMVYSIVEQSRGYVWIDSELGQGACFTILLPRVQGVIAYHALTKDDAQPRGSETLLIVEDEEALREAICGFLHSLGYTVLAASSGEQALSVANQEGRIDLLITDVVMPKMNGRELSETLKCSRPDLKTIYMSGYTDDWVLRNGIQVMKATLLQKPFSFSTLACNVRDTLGWTKAADAGEN